LQLKIYHFAAQKSKQASDFEKYKQKSASNIDLPGFMLKYIKGLLPN